MTIRIVHLSDIHFCDEVGDAAEAAILAVEAFAPTLTVVTGDLTLNGLPAEFRAAARWVKRLPAARLLTPGNHDTPYWNPILRTLRPFERYRRHIGEVETTAFDTPGLAARTLNSARGAQPRLNWSRGAISMRDLRGIDWGADVGAALRLFACHHPLIDIEGAPVQGGVRCKDAAVAHLAAVGVELILTGHEHNPFALPIPGAGAGRWAIGAGTLSHRLRGTPASFSTILVDDDAFEVTALAWSGQVFEPFRSWRLPRCRESSDQSHLRQNPVTSS